MTSTVRCRRHAPLYQTSISINTDEFVHEAAVQRLNRILRYERHVIKIEKSLDGGIITVQFLDL